MAKKHKKTINKEVMLWTAFGAMIAASLGGVGVLNHHKEHQAQVQQNVEENLTPGSDLLKEVVAIESSKYIQKEKLVVSDAYPNINFYGAFDGRSAKEKKELKRHIKEVVKTMESTPLGKRMLEELNQTPINVCFSSDSVSKFYQAKNKANDVNADSGEIVGAAVSPFLKKITSKADLKEINFDGIDVNLWTGTQNPFYTAKVFLHEGVHHLAYTRVYTEIMDKEKNPSNMEDWLLAGSLGEVFADNYQHAFEAQLHQGRTSSKDFNISKAGNPHLSDAELAFQTAFKELEVSGPEFKFTQKGTVNGFPVMVAQRTEQEIQIPKVMLPSIFHIAQYIKHSGKNDIRMESEKAADMLGLFWEKVLFGDKSKTEQIKQIYTPKAQEMLDGYMPEIEKAFTPEMKEKLQKTAEKNVAVAPVALMANKQRG